MKKLKVLIADDSVVYRTQIKSALSGLAWIEISNIASNGKIALERMAHSAVDLLILDLEMPEMDGLQTLREMGRRETKTKVLVFSSTSKKGAECTLEALSLGASDFIAKPGGEVADLVGGATADPAEKIRKLLVPKIVAIFPEFLSFLEIQTEASSGGESKYPRVLWDLFQPKVVVIGSSTGGPTVLENIFSKISGPLRCPILVAQHMPPVFTATLAERIQRICGIPTYEGRHGQKIEQNAIYVAPGNYHMTVVPSEAGGYQLAMDQGPLVNSVRPAVDRLFESAAAVFGERCLGIVLTGMGADGRVGAEAIKRRGGGVLIQSESTCVVFGMPGAVKASGAYDSIFSPDEIVQALVQKTANGRIIPEGKVC